MTNPVHKNMLKDEINGLQVLAQFTRTHADEVNSMRLFEAAEFLELASEEVLEALDSLAQYEEGDDSPLEVEN